MTRRRAAVLAVVAAALLALATTALGFWSADPATTGSGQSKAATVNQGATPTATAQAGRKVDVSWGASTLSNGQAVDGYTVKRYDANTDALQTVATNCTGTVTGLSCTETNVPAGDWKYTVTPKIGTNWAGTESAKSGSATVGAATLTLDDTLLGAAEFTPNATLTGALAGFADGESITYKLDDPSTGTTLSGSPSSANSSGGATPSITLPPTSDGAHTIYAVGGSGSQASQGIVVDTAAPSANASTTPGATTSGWNSTSPVSVTLSANDGTGSGVDFIKYTTDGSNPKTSGTAQTYSSPISVSTTSTVKFYARDLAGNETSVQDHEVKIDTTAPTAGTLTASESNAFTHVSGTEVFYNPSASNSGSFTVNAPDAADAESGVDRVNFPAYTGATGGGDDSTSPYSATYAWSNTLAATGSQTVTAYNNAGLTDTATFTLTQDTTPPTVPTPTVTGGYHTSLSVPVSLGTATDNVGGAGVSPTSNIVQRDTIALTNGTCGSFTSNWQNVTLSGGNDTTVTSGNCYRYRALASDNVANTGASSASNTAQVDTSAPTVTTGTITPSGPNTSVTGSTVFYNPSTGNSGSFTVNATASDTQSGIEKVTFPSVTGMTGGGDDTSDPYQGSYSWNDTTNASGSQTITAHNNATLTSTSNFTVTPDTTGPTGGALSVNGAAASGAGTTSTNSTGTVTINTRTDFNADAGSGVASSALTLRQGALSGNSCSGFGAPQPVSGTTGLSNAATGCYEYALKGTDNVGNASTLTTTVKVDRTAPATGALTLTAGNASFVSGTTVFYKGTPATQGSFTVSAPNATDPDSGVSKVNFPAFAGMSGGGDDTSSPFSATYTWTTSSATANNAPVTATNGVGTNGTASNFTLTPDNAAPTGGVLNVNGTAANAAGTTSYNKTGSFAIGTRTDFNSDGGGGSGVAGSVLNVRTGDFDPAANSCSNFGSSSPIAGNPAQTGTDGHCYEYTLTGTDNVGNAAILKTTVVVDSTSPTVTGLQLKNNGATAGRLEKGDQIIVTYSEHLKPNTICSTLPATDGNAQLAANTNSVNIADNTGTGGNDVLTVTSGSCAVNLGSINLGSAGFVTAATTFQDTGANRTVLDWDATARTITITLGTLATTGTVATVPGSVTPTITPVSAIQDLATNPLSTSPFSPSAGVQF